MKYNFSVDKFQLVEENSNSQFATVEVDVCRSGENTHRMPISRDAIKHSASSIKGKPILAAFNFFQDDFCGHEKDEQPVGFFEESEPQLVEKDNELYLRAKGKIWKKYFANAMDILKHKGGKTDVSMEIDVLEGEDCDGVNDGHIDLFALTGCTLLGVRPAIKGSECRVLSFSELQDEYKRESDTFSELQKFVEKRNEQFMAKSYKVNKTELKDKPWGDVDKTALRNAIMSASNKTTIVKSVYLLVEDGWQDAPSEHLKYPVMELDGDTFYYNRYGLASALAYAKQEGEQGVIDKVVKLYKKFDLSEEEEGERETMEQEEKKMSEEEVMQSEEEETKVECAEEEEEKEVSNDDNSTDEKDDEEVDEEKEETEEEKMSLDGNADTAGYLEMLENETEEYRALGKRVLEDEERGLVMCDVLKLAHECMELRAFKKAKEDEMRDAEVNKVMSEVMGDLDSKEMSDLKDEGMACDFAEISAFTNKVKAIAYANAKKKMGENKTAQYAKMSVEINLNGNKEITAEDVYSKYLK